MNRTQRHPRRTPWVEGSLVSWMGGVTLGVVLGVTLLIVTPRLMAAPDETVKAPTAAAQTSDSAPGDSAPGNPATAGSQQPAGTAAANPDPGSAPETAMTSSSTTQTPANDQTGGNQTSGNQTGGDQNIAAQSPAVAENTVGGPPQQDTNSVAETVAPGGKGDAAPTPNAAEGNAGAGATIFASNCAGCHGAQGGGGIGPSLVTNQGPKAWTLAQFTTVLRKGVLPEGRELSAVMPRFSDAQLSDTQVADLLAHIKTLN